MRKNVLTDTQRAEERKNVERKQGSSTKFFRSLTLGHGPSRSLPPAPSSTRRPTAFDDHLSHRIGGKPERLKHGSGLARLAEDGEQNMRWCDLVLI
jgi:hypothetical protein